MTASDPLRPTEAEALAAWGRRVRADAEQVARQGEVETAADFYAPVANIFRADPHRHDDPALDILRSLARPDETWLDVGAGGGRLALPLALVTTEVIAVEPSDGMLAVLRDGMAEHGIENVRILQERWPCDPLPQADAGVIANVGNDIEDIGPFLDALEQASRRLCVAVNWVTSPRTIADQLWEPVFGEPRATLPALPELIALLLARGSLFELRLAMRPPISFESLDVARRFIRRQLWLREGSERDQLLGRLLKERLSERDGRYAASWEPATIGVISWSPRAK
jgi:SAM-dependent methyltransferase